MRVMNLERLEPFLGNGLGSSVDVYLNLLDEVIEGWSASADRNGVAMQPGNMLKTLSSRDTAHSPTLRNPWNNPSSILTSIANLSCLSPQDVSVSNGPDILPCRISRLLGAGIFTNILST